MQNHPLESIDVVLCTSSAHWNRLLDVIDREELNPFEQFETTVKQLDHIEEVGEMIEAWTVERTHAEVEIAMGEAGIPCSTVRNIEEVHHDPHLEARQMVNEIGHPGINGAIRVLGMPIWLSNSELPNITPSPRKGGDTREMCSLLCEGR